MTAKLAWHGSSITSAELKAGEDLIPLEPEPGSRAARKEQFKRERPGLYAARHVAKAVGKVLAPLLGIGLLLNLLVAIVIALGEWRKRRKPSGRRGGDREGDARQPL